MYRIERIIQVVTGASLNITVKTKILYRHVITDELRDATILLGDPGSLLYLKVVNPKETKELRKVNISSQAQKEDV